MRYFFQPRRERTSGERSKCRTWSATQRFARPWSRNSNATESFAGRQWRRRCERAPSSLFARNGVEDAYADRAIALKTNDDEVLSSISQPGMIVADARVVGPLVRRPGPRGRHRQRLQRRADRRTRRTNGSVTTLDLDAEIAARARDTLRELGYTNVRVFAADGACRRWRAREFDDVVVTARSDDIAAAWWEALAENARLVVPLRLEGAGEYAVGFVRGSDGRLRAWAPILARSSHCAERRRSRKPERHFLSAVRWPRASSPACLRRIADVTAVRRESATPALLGDADVVIARPISLFAVKFT